MQSGIDVVQQVERIAGQLIDVCRQLDPDRVDEDRVHGLHMALTSMERLVVGARTRLARRVADSPAWQAGGHAGPAQFIAATTGRSVNAARAEIALSTSLDERPHLDAALEAGALSAAQAKAITPAVDAAPDVEAVLVRQAVSGECDLADLRRKSRQIIADADPDPDATRERHRRRRSFRAWTASDGEWHARLNGPAEHGAAIMASIKARADESFNRARREGRRQQQDATDFDGLLATVTDRTDSPQPRRSARERKVIGIIDIAALQRGRPVEGEQCHLAGVGPVPVSTIREMLGNATTALLFRNGTRDLAVAHLGRHANAFQRTALEARHYVCAVNGCGATRHLEIDHTRDWAATRRTHVNDLDWLCSRHHRAKSKGELTLVGPPGHRTAHSSHSSHSSRPGSRAGPAP